MADSSVKAGEDGAGDCLSGETRVVIHKPAVDECSGGQGIKRASFYIFFMDGNWGLVDGRNKLQLTSG